MTIFASTGKMLHKEESPNVFRYQLLTMLYRGFLLRKRYWFITTIEILAPFLVILIVTEVTRRSDEADFKIAYADTADSAIDSNGDSDDDSLAKRQAHGDPDDADEAAIIQNRNKNTSTSYASAYFDGLKMDRWRKYFTDQQMYYSVSNESHESISRLIDRIERKYDQYQPVGFLRKETNEPLIEFFTNEVEANRTQRPTGLIKFNDATGITMLNGSLNYRITFLLSDEFKTPDVTWSTSTDSSLLYLTHQLPILQMVINSAYFDIRKDMTQSDAGSIDNILPTFNIEPLPELEILGLPFSRPKRMLVVINIIMLVNFSVIVYRLQKEKSSRLKETLTISGLRSNVYWVSILINNSINLIIVLLLINMVLTLISPYRLSSSAFLTKVSFLPFLIIFSIHAVHLVLWAMLLSIPFNWPVLSTALSMIIYALPIMITGVEEKTYQLKTFFYIIPNGGLLTIYDCIIRESSLTLSDLIRLYDPIDNTRYAVGYICIYMLASCLILYTLVWYLDNVWPFQPGVPKSLFFCFSENYLFPGGATTKPLRPIVINPVIYSEPVAPGTPVAIGLRNVTKQYTNSLTGFSFVAVNDVSIDIHHGMITCLLGHNGAGKTTLMHMITGMCPPTDGQIFVNDFDLINDTEVARRGMSLCPQYDAFDERFTIEENLFIFAGIKGVEWSSIKEEVDSTVAQLSLDDHTHTPAKNLSGGVKRRLCVAMALIGNSKILILDEPTSGLDIDARHELWVQLKALRHKRTILMTTHDMEEADALADRVIIMDAGTIICAGSTMFLRKALCNGYILRICKKDNFNAQEFLALIKQYLPNASIRDDIGADITYNLNQFSGQLRPLSELFAHLEENMESLGVESFGVSASSLEEVFFKIGDQNIANLMMTRSQGMQSDETSSRTPHMKSLIDSGVYQYRLSGYPLIQTQMLSLLYKRFNVMRRQWLPFLISVLVSICVYTLLRWARDVIQRIPTFRGPVDLSVNPYDRSPVVVSSQIDRKFLRLLTKLASDRRFAAITYPDRDEMKQIIRDESSQSAQFIFGVHFPSTVDSEDGSFNEYEWTIYINMIARRSLALALDLVFNAIVRNHTSEESRIESSFEIITPIDLEKFKKVLHASSLVHIEGFDLILTFAFFSSVFIVYPIQERLSKAKLLQMMTGVSPIIFHMSNLLFDLLLHIIFSVTIICLSYAFVEKDFFGYSIEAFITLSLSGLTYLPLIYLASTVFASPLSGYTSAVVFQLISTFTSGLLVSLLDKFSATSTSISSIASFVHAAFHFNPLYTTMNALTKIIINSERNSICESITEREKKLCIRQFTSSSSSNLLLKQSTVNLNCCPDVCVSVPEHGTICAEKFSAFNYSDGLWINWVILLIQFIVITFFLIQYERGSDNFIWSLLDRVFGAPEVERSFSDEDVSAEEAYVKTLPHNENQPLVTIDLYKTYDYLRKVFAVKGISFHIEPKECFGFFGVNGAGKSTTFGMITGDIRPTYGEVWHGPHEITQDRRKCQRNIGYCPQYNPIIDELTGREMITLFASLRGVPDESTLALTEEMIILTGLIDCADKSCGNYSSGNKRRLSIALAVIGNPEIVLLDEPTAGVDPIGRRVIWTTLMQIKDQYNCAILLTSHSMEECEAICSKITIMVKGELVCIGSPQHLKERFGMGYTLQVRLNNPMYQDVDYVNAFTESLVNEFVKIRIIDRCEANITFKVEKSAGTWSSLLAKMDSLKEQYFLQDYQLTDTTLEQIFSKLHRLK